MLLEPLMKLLEVSETLYTVEKNDGSKVRCTPREALELGGWDADTKAKLERIARDSPHSAEAKAIARVTAEDKAVKRASATKGRTQDDSE